MSRWMLSYDRLEDPAALAVQPARLRVVEIDDPLSLEQFQKRYPSDVPVETVGLINQVGIGSAFAEPGPAKQVVGGKLP